ncbi:MAG: histidine phosphatase family protein [Thermoleophilia bacterium]|nr:histidine phosphatase family protein [Thermoleophilia bacterium]
MPDTRATTTIHLVRHGRTVLNRDVRFRGRLEVPLDDVGRAEAIAAGQALAIEPVAAVYSSPLGRALEVGTAIAAAGGLEEVHRHDDLVNLDYGRWEGLTSGEAEELDPSAWARYVAAPDVAICPGGEALAAAGNRVVDALRDIGSRHAGERVAAVTHGVMVRLAVLRVLEERLPDWQFRIPTGGSLTFEVTGRDIRLVSPVPDGTRADELAITQPVAV